MCAHKAPEKKTATKRKAAGDLKDGDARGGKSPKTGDTATVRGRLGKFWIGTIHLDDTDADGNERRGAFKDQKAFQKKLDDAVETGKILWYAYQLERGAESGRLHVQIVFRTGPKPESRQRLEYCQKAFGTSMSHVCSLVPLALCMY